MPMPDSFLLVRSCPGGRVPYDFHISRYPVTLTADGHPRIGTQDDALLYRTTWAAAARYCDLLSARNGLPPTYGDAPAGEADPDPASRAGALLRKSFRLPTPEEWDQAAHGWSGARTGDYFPLQKQHFRIPFVDYPTTEEQKALFENGYSRVEELIANSIGLQGMVAYAREWCGALPCRPGQPGPGIRWQEYATNYDNDIGYQTAPFEAAEHERLPFRIVLPCPRRQDA